jgi:hypothetical protein
LALKTLASRKKVADMGISVARETPSEEMADLVAIRLKDFLIYSNVGPNR